MFNNCVKKYPGMSRPIIGVRVGVYMHRFFTHSSMTRGGVDDLTLNEGS